jgi:hypothetical protein
MCVQSTNGNPNSVIYKNVLPVDQFGSVADYFEHKKRLPKDSKKVSRSGSLKEQEGTIVLLLCLDGSSEKAIIISSLHHPSRKTKLNKDTFAAGAMNGIEWSINEDGGFTVVFKGKTTADGKPADEKIGGSNIRIEKDGSIQISDNAKESIRIDQTKKIISLNAEKDININTDANLNLVAKANGNITIKDLVMKASGAANIEATGEVSVKSSGNLGIKGASVKIESDGTVSVKGTKINIEGPSVSIGAAGGTPSLTMSSTFLGIGNLGIPIISNAISGFSSSVKIGS